MNPTHRQLVGELEDRVEQIFAATEELREASGEGKTTRQLVDSIFRNVHSLKASASSAGFDDLVQIAHQFENLLHALRVGRAQMNDEVLRGFDETAQALFSGLRMISASSKPSYDQLFARLASLSESSARGDRLEVEVVLNAVPAEIWQALKEEEKHRLKQAVGEGASLFLVATSFDIANFDQLFQSLKQILTQQGELISTAPKVHNELPNKIDFRILYAREAELEQVQAEISHLKDVTVSEFSRRPTTTSNFGRKDNSRTRYSLAATPPRVIRIELADLDHLISSTHQLMRLTNARFEEVLAQLRDPKTFSLGLEEVADSIMSLAADLINLRMVPLERVLQRAFRAGKSVAAAADKEIDFLVQGQDLKIDKSLADAISDPLIHLVRNAVDHGIEDKSDREALGKPLRGNIRIEASTQQGQTRIEVSDDGKGIDPELVCRVGKDLGLLADNAHLDIDQSLRLLFRPGFTTAASVSGTSGRGVGLDVVERTIEGLGGNVKVSSERGSGSTFQMRLPVTFNTLDVVVVSEGGHSYLIDAAQVLSTTPLKAAANGKALLRLDELLGFSSPDDENAIVLQCELDKTESEQHRSVALQVSDLISTEQVLVRNLGSRGGRWRGVAGAAEMRDGRVALLLDLVALIK